MGGGLMQLFAYGANSYLFGNPQKLSYGNGGFNVTPHCALNFEWIGEKRADKLDPKLIKSLNYDEKFRPIDHTIGIDQQEFEKSMNNYVVEVKNKPVSLDQKYEAYGKRRNEALSEPNDFEYERILPRNEFETSIKNYMIEVENKPVSLDQKYKTYIERRSDMLPELILKRELRCYMT
jgi:hypothetical protein